MFVSLGTVLQNKPFVGIKLRSKMLLDDAERQGCKSDLLLDLSNANGSD